MDSAERVLGFTKMSGDDLKTWRIRGNALHQHFDSDEGRTTSSASPSSRGGSQPSSSRRRPRDTTRSEGSSSSESRNKDEAQKRALVIKHAVYDNKHCLVLDIAQGRHDCVYYTLAWIAGRPIKNAQELIELKHEVYDDTVYDNSDEQNKIARDMMKCMRKRQQTQYQTETRAEFVARNHATLYDIALITYTLEINVRVITPAAIHTFHHSNDWVDTTNSLDLMLTYCGTNKAHACAVVTTDYDNVRAECRWGDKKNSQRVRCTEDGKKQMEVIETISAENWVHSRLLKELGLPKTDATIQIATKSSLEKGRQATKHGSAQWRYDMEYKICMGRGIGMDSEDTETRKRKPTDEDFDTDKRSKTETEDISTQVLSITVIDLKNAENCVFHTMHYMMTGQVLRTHDVDTEKRKAFDEVVKDLGRVSNLDNYTRNEIEYPQDPDYWDRYVSAKTHGIGTIAAYAKAYNYHVGLYTKEGYMFIAVSDEDNWINLCVRQREENESHIQGMIREDETDETLHDLELPLLDDSICRERNPMAVNVKCMSWSSSMEDYGKLQGRNTVTRYRTNYSQRTEYDQNAHGRS
jgi:hypothetical protein